MDNLFRFFASQRALRHCSRKKDSTNHPLLAWFVTNVAVQCLQTKKDFFMKYKLIASDMDGTLLDSEGRLSERTKSAILRSVDAGIIFVAATGRPLRNTEIVNELFDVDMPFIVFNGAAAYMGKSKELLFESYLDFDLAKEAFDIGQRLDFSQIIWTGPRLWANRASKETLHYQELSSGIDMPLISDLSQLGDDKYHVSKVLWIAEPEKVTKLRLEMIEFFGEKLNCFSSMSFFLEFVSPKASKGLALAEVGRRFGIADSEMIAFGDAYNDVPMLEYAGYCVAMENAPDDIKQMCDHVTSSNDNDGVAVAIEQFVLS